MVGEWLCHVMSKTVRTLHEGKHAALRLVAKLLQKQLDKTEQCSNWAQRRCLQCAESSHDWTAASSLVLRTLQSVSKFRVWGLRASLTRPLSEQQLRYAALDAHCLLQLLKAMEPSEQAGLMRLGRFGDLAGGCAFRILARSLIQKHSN